MNLSFFDPGHVSTRLLKHSRRRHTIHFFPYNAIFRSPFYMLTFTLSNSFPTEFEPPIDKHIQSIPFIWVLIY